MDQKTVQLPPLANRCAGVLLTAASGDSLGWMTEFVRTPDELLHQFGLEHLSEFLPWRKQVGGRFQGYEDYIEAGEYSDDTQLTLCVAACIRADGGFDIERFCQVEFPLWLDYARGAGGTVKEAARKIQRQSASWNSNFFTRRTKKGTLDYRDSGANGAAMRIAPHVLANVGRWEQIEADIWRNSIISHGHPRAIIGALLYGYGLFLLLNQDQVPSGRELIEQLGNWVKALQIPKIEGLQSWLFQWNQHRTQPFNEVFENTQAEAVEQLRLIWVALRDNHSPKTLLKQLGCFASESRCSGLGTVLAGIYLFARQPENTQDNLILAANFIGSDTDSIAGFVGGLGGAVWGINAIPKSWRDQVQDAVFLQHLGEQLAAISQRKASRINIHPGVANVRLGDCLKRSQIVSSMRVAHRCLGVGTVESVEQKALKTRDKTVTLAEIEFDCGQRCKFAFRTDQKIPFLYTIKSRNITV